MTAANRQHAGAALSNLFAGSSATGGLAGRDHAPDRTKTPHPKRGTAPRESA